MKLTAQHYQAVQLLASGINGKDTAEKLGITAETVSRWKADFDFQAALNKILEESQAASQRKLRDLSGVALSTIEKIMSDNEAPAKERLTASFKVLEIVNLKTGYIGSSNADILKSEKEQSDLLESYSL